MSHKLPEQLKQELADARTQVQVGELYAHYKHPDQFYKIIDLVINEADDSVFVIYEAQYESLKGVRFARALTSFVEQIDVDGKLVERFTKHP